MKKNKGIATISAILLICHNAGWAYPDCLRARAYAEKRQKVDVLSLIVGESVVSSNQKRIKPRASHFENSKSSAVIWTSLGEPIRDISAVAGLQPALNIVKERSPRMWMETGHLLYNDKNRGYRFRWARGMTVPMWPRLVREGYEILIDETYRNNSRLNLELNTNGWKDWFTLHQALSLDMTLRHIALLEDGAASGAEPRAIEAAKLMAGRVWLGMQNLDELKTGFLGEALGKGRPRQSLSKLLDEVCANGHPGRFTEFYNIVFNSYGFRRSGFKTSDLARMSHSLGYRLSRLLPDIEGECSSSNILPLFMRINPIDGHRLAKEICDGVALEAPAYLEDEGQMRTQTKDDAYIL